MPHVVEQCSHQLKFRKLVPALSWSICASFSRLLRVCCHHWHCCRKQVLTVPACISLKPPFCMTAPICSCAVFRRMPDSNFSSLRVQEPNPAVALPAAVQESLNQPMPASFLGAAAVRCCSSARWATSCTTAWLSGCDMWSINTCTLCCSDPSAGQQTADCQE